MVCPWCFRRSSKISLGWKPKEGFQTLAGVDDDESVAPSGPRHRRTDGVTTPKKLCWLRTKKSE
jgi:hypothetical protein